MALARSSCALGTVTLVSLLALTSPARADKCTGAKLKAIAKLESGLLACDAQVAAKGDPTLLAPCVDKVQGKYTTAFGKAGSCGGETTVCDCLATKCATVVRGDLPDAGPSKCEAARLKAATKKAAAKLVCNAKAAAKGIAVDTDCIQKAEAKYQMAFGKTLGCGGDQTTVETAVDQQCVAAVGADAAGGGIVGTLCPTSGQPCQSYQDCCGSTCDLTTGTCGCIPTGGDVGCFHDADCCQGVCLQTGGVSSPGTCMNPVVEILCICCTDSQNCQHLCVDNLETQCRDFSTTLCTNLCANAGLPLFGRAWCCETLGQCDLANDNCIDPSRL